MGEGSVSRYEFGEYALLPLERLLLRGGAPVPLKPKVFDTLLALVRHYGRPLGKDELINLIWPDSFVEEGNLSQNVFTLRKALGESPRDHRYIVTVPGRGYLFVAKVRTIVEDGTDAARGNGPGEHSQAGRRFRTLAVLPLTFLPPADGESYLGAVIADALITRLNSGGGISVRPTTSVLQYADVARDPAAVGRELSVDAVVDGTVRRSGDRVRVNLQMVSAQSGETIWSNMFETPATDVLGIEDSISEQVASALSVRLEGGEGGTPARPRRAPCDLDVYQTYIKGRFFWNQRTEEGLHKGLECAREVVSAEPDFPLGYIGLADTYLLLGEYLYVAPQEAFPPALQAARKALSLDPEMAEAHTSLGEYHFYYARDWAAAEKHYRQALRLNPAYASAHSMYMWFLIAMRRFDEALEQIRIAQTLEPGSMVVNTTLGLPFYYAGDYERAARQFRRALEIEPGLRLANYYLGSALVHAGRSEEAVAEFEIMLAAQPLQQARGLLGYCLAVSGRAGEARRVLADLDALERERYVSPYVRAIVHAGLGETGAALNQLERAYDEQAAWVVWLKADPFFKSLSGEPRFVRLVERLRFPS